MNLQPTLFISPYSHPRLNLGGSTLPQPTSCGPDWWHQILHSCGEHRGRKTPNWPPPLLWQSQIPFQEKPKPTSHCWLLEMPSKCKPWRQHSSTSPRDNKDTTPTSEAALQLLCAPLGTNYSLYCRLVIPNPCSLQWLLHGSAFCELPCPYQLLRKPLAICCQACFETGLFNQEVNILYYCGFRIIIIYFKKQDKRQLRSEKSAWCSYLFIKLKCY